GVTHVRVSHRQLIILNTPTISGGVFFMPRRFICGELSGNLIANSSDIKIDSNYKEIKLI
ncbi:hypothetical protein POD11_17355, partial [Acinetobacter sp. P1(2023)]|uniref:hypothetical protein n=1 Tax=unclassified Acinetobacter TaxID=196816 RepID=UPI0021CD3C86